MFLVSCIIVGALAFGLGTLVRSADATILDARAQKVPVYAVVDHRSVSEDVRVQGEVVGSDSYPMHAHLPDGASRAVVTSATVGPGTALTNGTLLGTVSDRPIFVFSLDVPLFRDIHLKDTGSDVASLQKGLGISVSGVLDWQTLQAVRGLYAEAEIIPPGGWWEGTFVRLTEFVSLPPSTKPPVVRSISPVGTLLDQKAPFAELSLGTSFVNVRASVREADQIAADTGVTVQVPGGAAVTGFVAAIGDFQSKGTEAGRPPGRDIRVELPEGSTLIAGQIAAVVFGSASEPVTAVPTLAIRSDSDGEYVLRRGAGAQMERVPVVVVRNANGWTALDSEGLSTGDEVLVSP